MLITLQLLDQNVAQDNDAAGVWRRGLLFVVWRRWPNQHIAVYR